MTINFCDSKDIFCVMKFIDEYWKKNHILATNKSLVDYQYYDSLNDKYNFIIAKEDDDIKGVLGFIPNAKFDSEITSDVVWLALWKVKPEVGSQIGLKLLKFLESNVKFDILGTLGISDEANKLYKILRYKVGELKHYYIANKKFSSYRICKNPIISEITCKSTLTIQEKKVIDINEIFFDTDTIPNKSKKYLYEKYGKHPYYTYHFLTFNDNLLFVIRKINIKNTTIVRIVDAIGNFESLSNVSSAFNQYLEVNNYEYIDFLNYGLDSIILLKAGFQKLNKNCNNKGTIIPMYFEPFEQKNHEIRFAYKTKLSKPMFLFKADADQDRPNLIPHKGN